MGNLEVLQSLERYLQSRLLGSLEVGLLYLVFDLRSIKTPEPEKSPYPKHRFRA